MQCQKRHEGLTLPKNKWQRPQGTPFPFHHEKPQTLDELSVFCLSPRFLLPDQIQLDEEKQGK